MTVSRFDVLVVGAGPSGAIAAYTLASAGVRVGVFDRASFPRDKACGGGLQARVLRHLPFDVSPVIRSTMRGIRFTHRLGDSFTRTSEMPLVYGTLRREFDAFLIEQAIRKGAAFFDSTPVDAVEQSAEEVQVSTTRGPFTARLVIGADGANGVVRRLLNDEDAFFTQAGLYFEVPREAIDETHFNDGLMRVDWGTLPSGYAWVFPKTQVINIGVGAPVPIARRLKKYLYDFLVAERILRTRTLDLDSLNVRGHKLPTFTPRTKLQRGNVMVVGDAAGFIEPFTGDGISYGVHSACLAADVALKLLSGEVNDLSAYEALAKAEIVPEIYYSRKLMTFFNTFPKMIHDVFKRNDRVWQAFCRVLRGEESYDVFRRKKMGRMYFIWNYIDQFTLRYETRKLSSSSESETLFQRAVRSTIGSIIERV